MAELAKTVTQARASAAEEGLASVRVVEDFVAAHPEATREHEAVRLAFEVGLLAGFLEQARGVVLNHAHPWHEAPVDTADKDPHTQARFGQAYAVLSAADALLDDVVRGGDALEPCAAREVGLARSFVGSRAGEVVNDIIGVLGASSASGRYGLDRPWRELRIFAAEHPPTFLPLAGPGGLLEGISA